MPATPVAIPRCTVYGNLIADKDGDGRPDQVDSRTIGAVQKKLDQMGDVPIGDIRSSIVLQLGIDYLRDVGKGLAKKILDATFGHVRTLDHLQDMQRPTFTTDGRWITNLPLPSDTPRGRLVFPKFTKAEQGVLQARWDALNACSNQAPHLPSGVTRVDQIGVENARTSPEITVSGQTKSHYWLPNVDVLNVDAENKVVTLGLSAHQIFTFTGGGAGFAPLPEGPLEFSEKVKLRLPIVRPGEWTANLVDASNPSGAALSKVSFLYDPISAPHDDPRRHENDPI